MPPFQLHSDPRTERFRYSQQVAALVDAEARHMGTVTRAAFVGAIVFSCLGLTISGLGTALGGLGGLGLPQLASVLALSAVFLSFAGFALASQAQADKSKGIFLRTAGPLRMHGGRLGNGIAGCALQIGHGRRCRVPLPADEIRTLRWASVDYTPSRGLVLEVRDVNGNVVYRDPRLQ